MHSRLVRNLRKLGLSPDHQPTQAEWATLLDYISQSYAEEDQSRELSERSTAIASRELSERIVAEEKLIASLEARVAERTARLQSTLDELGKSEAKFRDLLQSSTDWWWEQDAEFRFTELSDSITQSGIDRAQLLGHTRWDQENTSPLVGSWDDHRATLQGRLPFSRFMLRRDTPAGIRYVMTSGNPIFDADGNFTGYRGVASDVTEETLAAHRLRALLNGITDRVWLKDAEGRYVAVNESCAREYGHTEADLAGKTAFDLFSHEAAIMVTAEDQEVMLSAKTLRLERRSTLDSEWREILKSAIHDSNGKVVGLVGISRDISERKEAQEKLERARTAALAASQAKSQFLANMSHEIRTPMNGVIGMSELLLTEHLTPTAEKYARTIQNSSLALLSILNDVLDFSKIEAGHIHLDKAPFELRKIVHDMVDLFAEPARRKSVALACYVDAALSEFVMGDAVRLRQVLLNLVANAVKFTAEGKIEIRVMKTGQNTISFSVTDTGVGIAEDKQQMIFDAFAQADNSTTRRYGGTGLGLAIAREIIRHMGGEIALTSRLGVGSVFSFTVSLEPTTPPEEAAPQHSPQIQFTGKKALLVEDEPVNAEVGGAILRRKGFDVVHAIDGSDAVHCFAQREFDIILMDCQMPGMDGLEATRRIRATEAALGRAPTPIIALTAHASRTHRDTCLRAGMDDYLTKPFDPRALYALLCQWLTAEPTAAPPTSAVNVLDADILAQLRELDPNGGNDFMRDVAGKFLDTMPKYSVKFREWRVRDLGELALAAHSLKSSAAILGAKELSALAATLEASCRRADHSEVERAVGELETEWQRVKPALQKIAR